MSVLYVRAEAGRDSSTGTFYMALFLKEQVHLKIKNKRN